MRAPYLACGVAGPRLTAEERSLLLEIEPAGVVLFARNVASRDQLVELSADLRALPFRPYLAIDLEGGRVNRLRGLLGELPAPALAAAHGPAALHALGTVLGAACAHFGIGVDFAPVLDLARPGGFVGGEDRCLGDAPPAVERAAAEILTGLERSGVAGCLKHYPGLGAGEVDSHRALPVLDDGVRSDMAPFHALASPDRGVMVAHAVAPALGDGQRPASLSPAVVSRLRRAEVGPIIADDLEMGALARFGTIPERAAAALLAGCDQVLVCNALDARADVVTHVERWSARDHGLRRAAGPARPAVAHFGRRKLARPTWDDVVACVEASWQAVGERP